MTDPVRPSRGQSLITVAELVRSGARTAADVTREALDMIASQNPSVNAFIAVDAERATDQAAEIDRRLAAGDDVGPLAGVPLAVKDTEDTIGYPTTFGSKLWANSPPADHDSVLVARLRAAGCVVVGKTNTPELAAKGQTDNPLYGVTTNPLDPTRTAGGSSGGAAAAVQTGMVPVATASDGGGSIRIPAACCGLPGFKASNGRIPDGGPQPVDWPPLTTRGVLTRTVDELLAVLDVVVGAEPTDLRSLPTPPEPWSAAVARQALPARVGWSPTLGYADIDPTIERACRAAVERLGADGVEIVERPTVFSADPVQPWVTLIAAYIKRSVGDRDVALMDPDVRAFLEHAEHISTQQFIDAYDECHRLNLQLVDAFESFDLLLTPTLALSPPPFDSRGESFVRATYPFNMTRSPAGTIPVGNDDDGLPIGLQIVGPQHADVAVLHLMRHVEAAFDHH